MAILLLLSLPPHPLNPKPKIPDPTTITNNIPTSKRDLILKTASIFLISLIPQQYPTAHSSTEASPQPSKSILSGIANTKSWFQFYGDGFSIRVPPQFEDIMEPEDYNAGLSLYGDKAKPKVFSARFSSSDGSEVLNVVIKPSNQFKITFLETYIAGATAPQSKWEEDGVKLRSAAISMTVL